MILRIVFMGLISLIFLLSLLMCRFLFPKHTVDTVFLSELRFDEFFKAGKVLTEQIHPSIPPLPVVFSIWLAAPLPLTPFSCALDAAPTALGRQVA